VKWVISSPVAPIHVTHTAATIAATGVFTTHEPTSSDITVLFTLHDGMEVKVDKHFGYHIHDTTCPLTVTLELFLFPASRHVPRFLRGIAGLLRCFAPPLPGELLLLFLLWLRFCLRFCFIRPLYLLHLLSLHSLPPPVFPSLPGNPLLSSVVQYSVQLIPRAICPRHHA
jgi:hypothetical protein